MNIHSLYHKLFRLGGFRRRRMQMFLQKFAPTETTRILDVGGTASTWVDLADYGQVTLMNLDRSHDRSDYPPNIKYLYGDALEIPFEAGEFEIAFSNSVIEHVGTFENQRQFAREITRVCHGVWVQTPAREFFLEPHLLTPFIHWFPVSWQEKMLRNLTIWGWLVRPDRQRVRDFLDEVRLLTRKEMQQLFPDCEIVVERWMGMPKSYVACRL